MIADFICPFAEGRKIFNPDILIWMDSIKINRFKKIRKIFQSPKKYNLRFISKNYKLNALIASNLIKPSIWNNKKPTIQMLGRYQPFHEGHKKLFEEAILLTGQVNIMVKDVFGIGDNPYKFKNIKKKIDQELKSNFNGMYKITKAPNIVKICFGRKVGYKFKKINLSSKIQKISGTSIRKLLRKKGLL